MHADKPALMSCSAGAIIGVDWRIAAFSEADIVSINPPIGSPQVGLAQLDERSREIFRQIVESYLATGEPVGSRNISRLIPITLSPASVRNVMADLEAL